MAKRQSKKRDQLVEKALELFLLQGFHATGIQQILDEAGIAKMTLYKHFESKEQLVLAAIGVYGERMRNGLMSGVDELAEEAGEKLLAVFDVVDERIQDERFMGCLLINAAAEYGKHDDGVHVVASHHKKLVKAYLRGLASMAGARGPAALADRLFMLLDGAVVNAQVSGDLRSCQKARQAGVVLLRDAGIDVAVAD